MPWAPDELPEQSGIPKQRWTPEQAMARDALLERVRVAAAARFAADTGIGTSAARSPALVILLDGPSGAGKSSLADFLAQQWPGPGSPRIVRMDDLCPGWDGLSAASAALGETLLAPLARTGHGRWRRWDWSADRPAEWRRVSGSAPLIVEGCGTLARANLRWADLTVWLDADDALRKKRALSRDGAAFADNWDRWQAAFERYLAREEPRTHADLRVDVTSWPIRTPRRRGPGLPWWHERDTSL